METNADFGIISTCWPINAANGRWQRAKNSVQHFIRAIMEWRRPRSRRAGNPSPRTANILPVYTTYLAAADQRGFPSHKRLLIDCAEPRGTETQTKSKSPSQKVFC